MTADRLWAELTRVALMGTARQPPAWPALEGPLGEVLGALRSQPVEKAMLSACAAVALYRRAGALPTVLTEAPPVPAPDERRPVCNAKAAQLLLTMLDGHHTDVLPEWLTRAAVAGVRVPHAQLPRLLDLALSQAGLRDVVTQVAGARGAWLADQNPAWRAATLAPPEVDWDTASRDERMRWLQHLRRTEAARARALVQSTWAQEAAEERQAQLALFLTGLGPDDEPFLESALDDRSKNVRRIAADLLSRLPSSRLCQRMTARVLALLQHDHQRLNLRLPTTCDREMQRDGVEPKARSGVGERAGWMMQMITAVPPSTWSRELGATAAELVRAAREGEWEALWLESWAEAAVRHRDGVWAEALLASSPKQRVELPAESLIKLVPPDRREALFLKWLKSPANAPKVLRVMLHHQDPWSPELTRATLESLRHLLANADRNTAWAIRPLLQRFALHMDLSALAWLDTIRPVDPRALAQWLQVWGKCQGTLYFRAEIHRAIPTEKP
ncbi:MAG: DUF5691 domain-containing protein [Myxococcota bacterium]